MLLDIAVTSQSKRPDCLQKASLLAQQLQLPQVNFLEASTEWLLVVTDAHLELQQPHHPQFKPYYVDFLTQHWTYRLKQGGGYREPLAKAVGLKRKQPLKLIDATAGFGRDAFLLASLGCHVLSLESSPIVAALLADGMARAAALPLSWRLERTDAIDYLTHCPAAHRPEVVYLDPLFPTRKKSALVKKDMQLLQQLGEHTAIDAELLAAAQHCATARVVVKRPATAGPFADSKPSAIIREGQCRFEIYL